MFDFRTLRRYLRGLMPALIGGIIKLYQFTVLKLNIIC